MTTLKIKYNSSIEFRQYLFILRKEQSIVVRAAFNKIKENQKQKEIRDTISAYANISNLDSWWIQGAIFEAIRLHKSRGQTKVIFGGRKSLKDYLKGLITKDQFKQNRLFPLISIGEALQTGNRKFRLDIQNNILKFQDKRGNVKFDLVLQSQLRDRLEQLLYIEDQTKERKQPLTVKIDENYVYLIFNPKQNTKVKQISNRVLAIDTNPNSIGWSVCDIRNDQPNVIDSGIIELKTLNLQSKNKKHHETFEICKFLVNKAVHYGCASFAVEGLSIKSKNNFKGRKFNKLVNNDWLRVKLFSNIQKRCYINNIKFIEVNPAFTSIIGGTIHSNFPDPISPTLEIARRAIHKYQKDKFYPSIPNVNILNEQWKQTLEKSFGTWRELADWLKISKQRYRVSLEDFTFKVFSLKSRNSAVICRDLYV